MLATLNERIARMTDSAVVMAAPAKPKAYSYLRWSSKRQALGDSERRQTTLAKEYAAAHGLELDTEASIEDLGVSAFKGANIGDESKLKAFLRAAEDGYIPAGSFLLVESLDRVSRAHIRLALPVLTGLVNAGVTVVTLADGKVYNIDECDRDPMALMWALLSFARANDESKNKSFRGKEVWKGRRIKAAKGIVVTARGPSWLKLDADRKWQVIEDQAAVVRRIFSMAANGVGPLGLHGR
jgi:DNA invertase Pin-like site-specific DNA recombinase